jgi:hypothetical protein
MVKKGTQPVYCVLTSEQLATKVSSSVIFNLRPEARPTVSVELIALQVVGLIEPT